MDDVLARLKALQASDVPVHGGRTLAYVYDSGIAEADLYPALSINGELSVRAANFNDLFASGAAAGFIGPGIRWNVLNYGRLLNNVRLQDARFQELAITYQNAVLTAGREIVPGTWDHWRLMEAACRAKFEQCSEARAALLATGNRPLTHVVRRDSRTIPGVVMAEIWMRIRRRLRRDMEAGPSRPDAGRARQAARS